MVSMKRGLSESSLSAMRSLRTAVLRLVSNSTIPLGQSRAISCSRDTRLPGFSSSASRICSGWICRRVVTSPFVKSPDCVSSVQASNLILFGSRACMSSQLTVGSSPWNIYTERRAVTNEKGTHARPLLPGNHERPRSEACPNLFQRLDKSRHVLRTFEYFDARALEVIADRFVTATEALRQESFRDRVKRCAVRGPRKTVALVR